MASRSDSNAPVLGIDLGTTNSAAAILLNGELSEIPNALGEFLTPSVVARDPADGSILVGRTAREILSTHPDRAAAAFKREMGTGREFELDGDPFSPVELSSFVLRSIKEDAARHLGYEVSKAVITVPAYFGEEQRQATKRSGELAGLEVVRILNEPTAAAMAYGLHRRDRDGSFLVFDLGGGTFDVSVMELFEGSLEVQSTAGESRLGGEDFSRRLASAAAEKLELDFEVAEFRDPVPFSRLLRRCEIAKRKASDGAELVIEAPAFPHADLAATTIRFGKEDLKAIWQGLFESLRKPCRVALRGAQLDVDDLDEVVLVGGATRMPDVRALVKELFDMEPKYDLDPDLAVARGAAVQAGLYAQDAAVEDLVVTDVLSHSLGVEVIYTIAGRLVEGNFSPVIHRNTTIPTSRSEVYATVHDGQNGINLEIFEGESRKVENCRRLGSLSVKVPKRPAGEEKIEVRFTYDLGGMLEVEATVVSTQKRSSKVFERRKDPMPEEDRKRALKRLEELKLDPGEKAINRDLLARAEALLEEVGPDDRSRLEQGILQFEAALHARTPSIIRAARRDLRRLCDAIDAGDRW